MPETLLAVSTLLDIKSGRRREILSCSHRFPLGSPHQGDRTIADVAVDSLGALVPLVAFHEIPSRCNTTSGLGDIALDKQPDEGSMTKRLKDEDETAEIGGHATTTIDNPETPSSTPSLAAHKEHPHIITRCVYPPFCAEAT